MKRLILAALLAISSLLVASQVSSQSYINVPPAPPVPCPTASTGITITGSTMPNCSFAASGGSIATPPHFAQVAPSANNGQTTLTNTNAVTFPNARTPGNMLTCETSQYDANGTISPPATPTGWSPIGTDVLDSTLTPWTDVAAFNRVADNTSSDNPSFVFTANALTVGSAWMDYVSCQEWASSGSLYGIANPSWTGYTQGTMPGNYSLGAPFVATASTIVFYVGPNYGIYLQPINQTCTDTALYATTGGNAIYGTCEFLTNETFVPVYDNQNGTLPYLIFGINHA